MSSSTSCEVIHALNSTPGTKQLVFALDNLTDWETVADATPKGPSAHLYL